MSQTWTWTAPSTTTDPATSILVRVHDDEGYITVSDLVGFRYGHAQTVVEAVTDWANDVKAICNEPEEKLANPLLAEARAYKTALRHDREPT